uniref:Putative ABCC protein n=1 Tax=Chrysomela populi TaxID=154003 RepID=A0A0U9HY72_CHRPP
MDHSEKVLRKVHPREKANIFSLLTFLYTRKLFRSGFKKDLEDDDLYEVIKQCRSKKCADHLEAAFKAEGHKRSHASVFRVIWNCYGIRYLILGVCNLSWKLIHSLLEPNAVAKLVGYFKPGQTQMTLYDALYYAGIMVGLKAMHGFYHHNYRVYLHQLAIQIRTSFCSLIYRKTLRISPKAMEDTNMGNIVTVITKDVLQFEHSIWLFNDLWTGIVQMIFVCYMIYSRIGVSSIVGVLLLMTCLPVQAFLSKIIKKIRSKLNKRTDERLQQTREILSSIRIIKMYTWENIFIDKINKAREKEMSSLLKNSIVKTLMMAMSHMVSKFSFYALIMIYIWMNEYKISVEDIFYVTKIFGQLKMIMGFTFSVGFTRIAELVASLERIQNILNLEDLPEDYVDKPDDEPQIDIRDVSVEMRGKQILRNVQLKMEVGLTVVTGHLGCGKSSLIKLILKSYPVASGELRTRGRKSYASQDAWLFPSSIKQNILFGEKYDYERYKKVVEVCALEYDFAVLERGDETILTDGGTNLSKGQQARVNLARAVYRDSDIYLVDDALTALDPRVQDHIFDECVRGFLRGKLVVLVTHNARHIESADMLVVMADGGVKIAAKQNELSAEVLAEIEREEEIVESLMKEKLKEAVEDIDADAGADDEKAELLAVAAVAAPKPRKRQVYHEEKKQGGVDPKLYYKYIQFGGGVWFLLVIVLMYGASTLSDSSSNKMLTNWVNQQASLTGSMEKYFGNASVDLELMAASLANASAAAGANVTAVNETLERVAGLQRLEVQAAKSINLYSVLLISSSVLEIIKFLLLVKFIVNASFFLHKTMVRSVIRSVMAFFDNFFVGNILNRFSQDLYVVDEVMPHAVSMLIMTGFMLAGNVGLIASVNWKFLVPSFVLLVSLVVMRFIYIPTSRSLKRLEAATRSPIIGHLNSTMEGLTTIRAYRAQDILKFEFDKHQDLYTSAYFTSVCAIGAFSLYMDVFSAIYEAFVIGRFLFLDVDTAAGDVGLTITQAGMLAGVMQMGLQEWTQAENLMTSFERALEYTGAETEAATGCEPPGWPSRGEIRYSHVSLTYTNSHEPVLANISFHVKAKEKIGIVGRTGAGKSSIISTLFRLYDFEGDITIDDVPTKSLSLEFLRRHISIIPQDPIMFSGTIRSNVDPSNEFTDEEIWTTLHKVQLDSITPSLSTDVSSTNFSTGQRQLLCIARAIIRKTAIVVLDEATANMDPETERLAQRTVDANLADRTLLVIAHRLETVLACDRVMVLDHGRVVEFDTPEALRRRPDGLFAGMLRNAGLAAADEG